MNLLGEKEAREGRENKTSIGGSYEGKKEQVYGGINRKAKETQKNKGKNKEEQSAIKREIPIKGKKQVKKKNRKESEWDRGDGTRRGRRKQEGEKHNARNK